MATFFTIVESSVLLNKNLTNTEKIVYSIISSFSNNKKGYCFLRYNELANYSGIKKRQLYKIINKLEKMNLIVRYNSNNIFYLMPAINLLDKNKNKKLIENAFYYDWLDSDD